jgi:hypothetical protein
VAPYLERRAIYELAVWLVCHSHAGDAGVLVVAAQKARDQHAVARPGERGA